MKRIIVAVILLTLTHLAFSAEKYYAEADVSTKEIKSSYKMDEALLESIANDRARFEITQGEYETNVIAQAKIDAGVASKFALLKDINTVSKLEKCGFLVIMDYLRSLGLEKTNGQFRDDIITKYEAS